MNIVDIDSEFQALIPALTADEFRGLEASLLSDGCRDSIVVWQGKIIDGHNRYKICQEHGIKFSINECEFNSREDVKIWIIQNQFGRRNLTAYQRAELALELEGIFKEKAKERMLSGKADPMQKSAQGDTGKTRDAIADIAGVSHDTLAKVKAIKGQGAEELIDIVSRGNVSISAAATVSTLPKEEQAEIAEQGPKAIVSAAKDIKNHRALGSGENEWYTPEKYVEAVRGFFGKIDLDPASSAHAQQTIKAIAYYTKDNDGLMSEWKGRVFLNPPYSQPAIRLFIEKAVSEFKAGRVSEAILLTHNYTDTAWAQHALNACAAVCFVKGRIGFLNPEGKKATPTQGQTFFYLGDRPKEFAKVFKDFGCVLVHP